MEDLTSGQRPKLLPTPNTRDRYVPKPGRLKASLAREVERIGENTPPPSEDGKESFVQPQLPVTEKDD